MTDDMLRAVAKKNGVAQVNFFRAFISQKYRDGLVQQPEARRSELHDGADPFIKPQARPYVSGQQLASANGPTKMPRPPLSDLIDHIDHMVKVAGVDHVGLGSDFDGICGALARASIRPPTCRRSRKPCWTAATAPPILIRFLAAICCASSREVERVSREMQAERLSLGQ